MAAIVRQSMESTLFDPKVKEQPWRKFAGVMKGGPPDLSPRKGFSRG
jgi:hypothetical protein